MNAPEFSIILPVYNQTDHIRDVVWEYITGLKKLKSAYELLLIVNDSQPGSYEKIFSRMKKFPFIRVFTIPQKGWGRAVKFGISKAQGAYICYTNSARTNVNDLVTILRFATKNTPAVVKATRIVRDNWIRKFGSTLYNIENRILLKTPIWDVNGTPKVFPKSVIKKIHIESDNDLIDAEIMAKCFQKHIPMLEIPITFTSRKKGRSTTNILSALHMYIGLWKHRHHLRTV